MAAANDSPLVLVTSASGFIATHIIKQLQENSYKVRGVVPNLEDEEKVKHLHNLCPEANVKLELVQADTSKSEAWDEPVKDAQYVIHVISPFPKNNSKDDNELVQPAVDETLAVLKACIAAKSVKRVLMTSSTAAILSHSDAGGDNKVYNEDDWSDPTKLDPYGKCKTLAEKAAWEYIKELSDEEKIELTVINPSYVMGPVLPGTRCFSSEVVKVLLERDIPVVPKLNFSIVDVRDVAAAHVKAMTMEEAVGKRFIVNASEMWMKDIAQVLLKEFKSQGYNVPTMNCPNFVLQLRSLYDKTVKKFLPQVGKVLKLDNTRMKETLQITPRENKETIIDMAYSLIEGGFIKKIFLKSAP
ncbi:unnamed protein product [Acanthosepion pharaonis]|uniref:NAD-dependent epimerase/dehydratase domain-containing protein n=1 Tax=Acanthosepion pharaonis TaxID=158019 RepID=A0A812C0K2_ACAPH|nr:unnamed protein product [Sepia pharaonis]